MSSINKRRAGIATVCSRLGTGLLALVILICIPMTVPKLFGYRPYTVISGSMEPAIAIGSLVYVRDVEPEAVVAKDVIAYYGGRDRDSVITHRVVENNISDREFITKGDANSANDVTPVPYHNLLGRVELTIPSLGYAAQLLTIREGKFAMIGVIGVAMVLSLIAAKLNRRRKT